jgi:small conductance mechanosensitive channel
MGQGVPGLVARSLQAEALQLLDKIGGVLPSMAAAVTVLLITWGLAALARRSAQFCFRYIDNPTRRNLIRHVTFYLVWVLGIFAALGVLGVNPATFIAGLGLGGVALGFALKDLVSNLVSGLMILLTGTFQINDQIVVGDTEGTVERIEVRATHIRTYDGRLVLVPNGDVFVSRVTNNTASPLRRASVFVYLDYRQDLHRALSLILETIARVPGVVQDPAASMRLHDLTPQHLHIEARVWTDSRRTDFVQTASTVRIAIVDALSREGIALPHPEDRQVTLVEPQALLAQRKSQ